MATIVTATAQAMPRQAISTHAAIKAYGNIGRGGGGGGGDTPGGCKADVALDTAVGCCVSALM